MSLLQMTCCWSGSSMDLPKSENAPSPLIQALLLMCLAYSRSTGIPCLHGYSSGILLLFLLLLFKGNDVTWYKQGRVI